MKDIVTFIIEKKSDKEKAVETLSLLDKTMNGDESVVADLSKIIRPNGPTIYAFITNKVKDAIKIGYTDQHPEKRIEQWRDVYGKEEGDVVCMV